MNIPSLIHAALTEHQDVIARLASLVPAIQTVGERLRSTIGAGHKVLLMGNGGSAADSQHIAAELVGRYKKDRAALPAIALTTDSSILTSIGNDYGFDHVFARQVETLCSPGDVVIGISTSGNSANVVAAIKSARKLGAYTVGMTGAAGGRLAQLCDTTLAVPSSDTPRIQEAHILIGHILCELVEAP